jgi:large subunit ribosomal protein L3
MTTSGIVAKKIGMTRMVDAEGQMTAVTLLQIETQQVTKVLSPERDGYHAIQVGYYAKPERKLGKPDVARLRKANIKENFTRFKEFRLDAAPAEGKALGATLTIAELEGITALDVVGVSKGRGFKGAHVRWNSAVGRMSHGSRFHRSPGSLGMRSTPGKIMKNRHQPGHHGDVQKTIQNLKVLDIDKENNVIAVRGSVPGHRDGFLVLRPSIKIKKKKAVAK